MPVPSMPADSARILVVDDRAANVRLLCDLLEHHGYKVATAANGDAALATVERESPDLVLLDVIMPGLSGYDVCRALRNDPRWAALPIVLITSHDVEQRVRGLEAGADDFLNRDMVTTELLPRVRSLVRVKRLFDQTVAQSTELARLNAGLEAAVAEKISEVERLSKLKRFVSPKLAQRIIDGGLDDPLISHRRDIVVVFFDLRGFTAFAEVAAPEDVMFVLREFHEVLGTEAQRCGGTIERYAGDGVMIFFNDPEPSPQPCADGAQFAIAVMCACTALLARWQRNSFALSVSSGIAYGFATLGVIGYGDRIDYGAIGSVTNLAARLCAEAPPGQILISARAATTLPPTFHTRPTQPHYLKGFRDPVAAYLLLATGEPNTNG